MNAIFPRPLEPLDSPHSYIQGSLGVSLIAFFHSAHAKGCTSSESAYYSTVTPINYIQNYSLSDICVIVDREFSLYFELLSSQALHFISLS